MNNLAELSNTELIRRFQATSAAMDWRKERQEKDDTWVTMFTKLYLPLSKELTKRQKEIYNDVNK